VTEDRILLDEHVGRIFERLLSERGYDVVRAKDQFGEHTNDVEPITERLGEDDGGIESEEWDAVAPDEPHPSERDG
jgi:hypothetical protein